jgi:hypothetical protein
MQAFAIGHGASLTPSRSTGGSADPLRGGGGGVVRFSSIFFQFQAAPCQISVYVTPTLPESGKLSIEVPE